MSAPSEQPHVSTQRQIHCCEWLFRAAVPVSSRPDKETTVGDDSAANLPPPAHAGSTRHWILCRVGYRASRDPRLQCIPGKGTASAHPHAKRTCGWASSAESTTHAVVPALVDACTAQHKMPTAGGARDCLLFIDAVCATAAAVVTTICKGVSMARDKPVVAASMYALQHVVPCCNLLHGIRHPSSHSSLAYSAEVVQYLGVKSGATSAIQYNYVAAGLRRCLTRQCSCNKRAAMLRCNSFSSLQRCKRALCNTLGCCQGRSVARRCAGKCVEILCVAMGCI